MYSWTNLNGCYCKIIIDKLIQWMPSYNYRIDTSNEKSIQWNVKLELKNREKSTVNQMWCDGMMMITLLEQCSQGSSCHNLQRSSLLSLTPSIGFPLSAMVLSTCTGDTTGNHTTQSSQRWQKYIRSFQMCYTCAFDPSYLVVGLCVTDNFKSYIASTTFPGASPSAACRRVFFLLNGGNTLGAWPTWATGLIIMTLKIAFITECDHNCYSSALW